MPRKLKLLMIASLAVICLPSPPLSTFAQPASTSRRPVAPPSKAAEGSPESAVAIEKAIEHGKAFLYAQQREGNWEESQKKMPTERGGQPGPMGGRGENPVVTSQWGGLTSIAVFSLIAAGDNVRDERLTKAMAFIKTSDITGTYALGLHAQIWNLLPSNILKEYRANIQKDGRTLFKGSQQTGDARGLYHYTPDDDGWDNSTSQYGVLGMWGCEQVGYEVPSRYWQDVESAWIRHQDKNGGWSYGGGMRGPRGQGQNPPPGRQGPPGGPGGMGGPPGSEGVTLSMTAAGVATLFITQDYLHDNLGVACKGNYNNPPIEAGVKWISDHYDDLATDRHYYYTQFGISRIGLASGLKYLGSKDWYREGAREIVNAQLADGSWKGSISDTAFALLFLVRGRAPVVMNKLEYSVANKTSTLATGNWNQRPRDAANVTRWIGKQLERDLNWQAVTLQVPAEQLHDAPILYLAGNQTLSFTVLEEEKLRDYVERGGLILGNADCGSKAFADSFQALGQKLFDSYEFRKLPTSHRIYTAGLAPLKIPIPVQGLSNGCRELMLLIPSADPARSWQTKTYLGKEDLHLLLANIFLYAVDKKNLRYKGDTFIVSVNPGITTTRTLKLARIEYPGNWNPEPGGWRQLAAVLHNQQKLELQVETIKPSEGNLKGNFAVAHLTGTVPFHFTDTQRTELKQFVEGGGTLIVDAAGGSGDFATAAEAELNLIFGEEAKTLGKPLPPEHKLYTAGEEALGSIAYRTLARKLIVGSLNTPRLSAIEMNGRPAVIFSRDDLSAGLVGQSVDGIIGYEPESATRIMSKILRYISDVRPQRPAN